MKITKPQIQVSLNKTEMNQLISEGLTDPETAASIKRALTPLLAKSFPQFPEFTNISFGDTDESGATEIILKQPRDVKQSKSKQTLDKVSEQEYNGPIKSIEPTVIDEPAETVVEPFDNY